MVCGRDAQDKGGRRRYNGCGLTFKWGTAPVYEIETVFRLEPPPPDTLGIKKGNVFPFSRQGANGFASRVCLQCEREVNSTCFQCISCPPALVTRSHAYRELNPEFEKFWRRLEYVNQHDTILNTFIDSMRMNELQQMLKVDTCAVPVSYCWDCMQSFLKSEQSDKPMPVARSALDKVIFASPKERLCSSQTCCFRVVHPRSSDDRFSDHKSVHRISGGASSQLNSFTKGRHTTTSSTSARADGVVVRHHRSQGEWQKGYSKTRQKFFWYNAVTGGYVYTDPNL